MDFLFSMKFCAPVYHIGILLIGSTVALIFGRAKLGLLMNYIFFIYWAYISDREYIIEKGTEGLTFFPAVYFGFGFMILILGFFAFHVRND